MRWVSVINRAESAGFDDMQQICIFSHLSRSERVMSWRPSIQCTPDRWMALPASSRSSPPLGVRRHPPAARTCSSRACHTATCVLTKCAKLTSHTRLASLSDMALAVAALRFPSFSTNPRLIITSLLASPLCLSPEFPPPAIDFSFLSSRPLPRAAHQCLLN